MIEVTPSITIDDADLVESFVKASGPGGQNVNKVATAVQLRFDVRRSGALSEPVKRRLEKLAGSRMTTAGELVIRAERFRTLERNRADARDRLVALIRRASVPPKPRRKTRLPVSAMKRRREAKSRRSAVKIERGKPTANDE